MRELRGEALGAVYDLEAITVEPSVEQYVDAVLAVVDAAVGALADEWDRMGLRVRALELRAALEVTP